MQIVSPELIAAPSATFSSATFPARCAVISFSIFIASITQISAPSSTSPLQGNVFKVLVEEGAEVQEGALVCIIEAMKMENEITAHKAGVVAELPITEGAAVSAGDTLAVIKSEG